MPKGERAYQVMEQSRGLGPGGPGPQSNEAIYDRLDKDATNKALTTDGNKCPRCDKGLWFYPDEKSCLSCGWSQELLAEVQLDASAFKAKRGFIDYPYNGKDEEYTSSVLRAVLVHTASGYKTTTYKCPDFANYKHLSACALDLTRHTGGGTGRTLYRCSRKHSVLLLIEEAMWIFPWDVKR